MARIEWFDFARDVRDAYVNLGWTQVDAARAANLSPTTISTVCRGKGCSAAAYVSLCTVLNLPLLKYLRISEVHGNKRRASRDART